MNKTAWVTTMVLAAGLAGAEEKKSDRTFGEDVAFLKHHVETVVLEAPGGKKVAVVPAYQGRVMTSSAGGDDGASFGWLNYPAIERGIQPEDKREGLDRHILVFGGEERLWFGPEGGQYAIFFPAGTTNFAFETWKTPALIDSLPFQVSQALKDRVVFQAAGTLTNVSGTAFEVGVTRTVRLLSNTELAQVIGLPLPETVAAVGFETDNRLRNAGAKPWTREGGLLSVWMLGMLKHGERTTVVIPLQPGEGPAVNSDYFGAVGPDLLRITNEVAFFKADGKHRTKIGIPPRRARPLCGSWDPLRGVLTLVKYNLPADAARQPYVRSQWTLHKEPYAGDVINAYNDGPNEAGDQLGPFYEIESSSPALPLEPSAAIRHVQQTVHLQGDSAALDAIARSTLGVGLDDIEKALR